MNEQHNVVYHPWHPSCIVAGGLTILYMKWLHRDFAEIGGLQVLIIIDVHFKWIEVKPLHMATAATTIQALKTFFSNF